MLVGLRAGLPLLCQLRRTLEATPPVSTPGTQGLVSNTIFQ